jgi:hypothetical protein
MPQVPLAWHVCTPFPEHCVDPGLQAPQMPEQPQPKAVPHCPVAPQVCTPLPEHFVEPGVQTPMHVPLTHA